MINTFDIDGVIFMGEYGGVYPGPSDIIITGRSYEEKPETDSMLAEKGITNTVYMNPLKFDEKTRESSGLHKAKTIAKLLNDGYKIGIHFEDDPIQANIIMKTVPVNVVLLQHELVEKENIRHEFVESCR